VVSLEVKQVLIELGETPFEKEEQEDGMMNEMVVEKQVNVLNESLISFFKINPT
jgi:hypothetical protein